MLRRSYREEGTVKNETLGNLSHLPEPLVDIIRRSLQGETFVPLAQAFDISSSRAHGHVRAVATAMQRLGFAALKSASIRILIEQGTLQLDLFDERNLLELSSADYPGERLVACRNPQLAKLRAHKREALLTATELSLAKIKARVAAGKLTGQDAIGLRVGKIVNRYKVAKHFELAIGAAAFSFQRQADNIAAEAALARSGPCRFPWQRNPFRSLPRPFAPRSVGPDDGATHGDNEHGAIGRLSEQDRSTAATRGRGGLHPGACRSGRARWQQRVRLREPFGAGRG